MALLARRWRTESGLVAAPLFVGELPEPVILPTISEVGTGGEFQSDSTVTILGQNFVVGNTTISLRDKDGREEVQSVKTDSPTSLTFAPSTSTLKFGEVVVKVATPDGATTRIAQMNPPLGYGVVELAPGFLTGETSVLYQAEGITPTVGDQLVYSVLSSKGEDVLVNSDGQFTLFGSSVGEQTFEANIHSGGKWHTFAVVTVIGPEGEEPVDPDPEPKEYKVQIPEGTFVSYDGNSISHTFEHWAIYDRDPRIKKGETVNVIDSGTGFIVESGGAVQQLKVENSGEGILCVWDSDGLKNAQCAVSWEA